MIEITSVTETPIVIHSYSETFGKTIGRNIDVEFILFNSFVCTCTFEDIGFDSWDGIKKHIEDKLINDFKNNPLLNTKQL